MYHNHQKKDASHPWFTKASTKKLPAFTRNFLKSPLAPFLAYPIYLFEGSFDGSHVFPFSKLYRTSSARAKIECAVSAVSVFAFMAAIRAACGSWTTLALGYGGCYASFSFWLFMVTYFQHHDHGTLVYDDSDWSYLKGALETIDRTYGYGLDGLHHNISDGHVVHHLFFTQVPHYHLTKVGSAPLSVRRALRSSGARRGRPTRESAARMPPDPRAAPLPRAPPLRCRRRSTWRLS
jgi:omega-3 fatty acid desaturase (delta-15 desaturase)